MMEIVCQKGHSCGMLLRYIPPSGKVRPEDFTLIDAGMHDRSGHFCPACNERVTKYHHGTYSVLTATGWVGDL
jgi:hypothetical protein